MTAASGIGLLLVTATVALFALFPVPSSASENAQEKPREAGTAREVPPDLRRPGARAAERGGPRPEAVLQEQAADLPRHDRSGQVKRAMREHSRDVLAIVGLLVVGLLSTWVIVQNQRLRIPFIEETPFQLKAELQKEGRLETVRYQLREEKTLDLLLSRAKITEKS